MNKAEMIREVVGTLGIGASNQEIKAAVMKKHRRIVTSAQIINTVGAQQKRLAATKLTADLEQAASRYLSLVGDIAFAKTLLDLEAAKRCT